MIRALVRRVARQVANLIGSGTPIESPVDAWNRRAREYGARAVFNLVHTEDELAHVTEMQKRAIYPHVRAALRNDERVALDFGCGPGRFTADLAKMIAGRAIGVDTTRPFIEMASRTEDVDYRVMTVGRIPVGDAEIDLLWVCLVLGGIVDDDTLERTIGELDRVLRPGGLLVVIENTSEKSDAHHWRFRSVSVYQHMLAFARLEHKGDYEDAKERISILIGRKVAAEAPTGSR